MLSAINEVSKVIQIINSVLNYCNIQLKQLSVYRGISYNKLSFYIIFPIPNDIIKNFLLLYFRSL